MRLLNQFLGRGSNPPEYSDPDELRAIYYDYINQWPENHSRYQCWKPASLLPAPKWAIKRAMKLRYAEWPEPIDWTVFSVFFMEFADLALHLSEKQYSAIEEFRKQRIVSCGMHNKHDPLLFYSLSSTLAASTPIEHVIKMITAARDGLRRSSTWNPVEVDDNELDAVRRIVVESTTDFAVLIQEWRFYILSIGRDRYISEE